jgi:hypothetical protein
LQWLRKPALLSEYDNAPVTGCRTPSFTGAPCARSTEGIAMLPVAATATLSAVVPMDRRLIEIVGSTGTLPSPERPPPAALLVFLAYHIADPRQACNGRGRPDGHERRPRTLIDKLWSAHEIARREDGATLLWVDRHCVHEGSFMPSVR